MKTLKSTLLSLVLFFGMSTTFAQGQLVNGKPYVISLPDGPDENVETLQTIYDAFATGDVATLQKLISDDVVWNEAEGFPYADLNPYVGKKAVFEGIFGRIATEWEYFKLTGIQIYPMYDDRVFATGFYEGKYKKTGKTVKMQMAHFCLIKDGKLVQFQQFADTKKATQAITK